MMSATKHTPKRHCTLGIEISDEARRDALAQTLVISGDEATVRNRLEALLTTDLDELMLQLVSPLLTKRANENSHFVWSVLFRKNGSLPGTEEQANTGVSCFPVPGRLLSTGDHKSFPSLSSSFSTV